MPSSPHCPTPLLASSARRPMDAAGHAHQQVEVLVCTRCGHVEDHADECLCCGGPTRPTLVWRRAA